MKKVIVFGTFDILHPGHIHMLKEARQYGDYLIAVVARDATVCEVKGKKPKNDEHTRRHNLNALAIANKVMLGCLDNRYEIISKEQPDVVALGYDQTAFVDKLAEAVDDHTQIVRLSPYLPKIYKSSKLRAN